jgi:hypothetical protein
MTISKFKVTLAVLAAASAAIMILQHRTQQQLHNENDSLREQLAQLRSVKEAAADENAEPQMNDEKNELLRLRGEAGALRAQTNQLAELQEQNRQLDEQRRQYAILEIETAKQSTPGLIRYARDHGGQLPATFDQAGPYFENPETLTNLSPFEMMHPGLLTNFKDPHWIIVLREIRPWPKDGQWVKAYGFADGHMEVHAEPDGNFDPWEQQHITEPPLIQ